MKNPVILIVEDHKNIRKIISSCLQSEGYHTMEVETGEKALRLLRAFEDIKLVLMDIGLPGMSGLDAIKSMKEIRKKRSFQVCFISAHSEKSDILEAIRSGGDDYIVKPMDIDTLLEKVQNILKKANTRKIV